MFITNYAHKSLNIRFYGKRYNHSILDNNKIHINDLLKKHL